MSVPTVEIGYLSHMKKHLLLLCLYASAAHGQTDRFSYESFKDQDAELHYRLLTPDAVKRKLPLVIFLHGSGERGDDNEAQLKWGVQQFARDENLKHYPAFVAAPQCPSNQTWSAYDGKFKDNPTRPLELVRGMIDDLVKRYPIDENRIYITGLSMGGFGTFDALARYPELFAAAVPVCGSGDPSTVDRYKDVPIWIYTGAEDDVVLPERTVRMFNVLMDAGAKPGFTLVPEVGHFSWIAAYSDGLLMQWLFRQRKE